MSDLETSSWEAFIEAIEAEFDGDYDGVEEKLCVYFHKGPRFVACFLVLIIVLTKGFGIVFGRSRMMVVPSNSQN